MYLLPFKVPIIGKRTMGGLVTPASGKAESSKGKADNKSSWERPVAEDSEDGNESRRSLTEDGDEATWFEGLGGSRSKKDTLGGGKSESFISLEDTLRDQNANNKDKDKERYITTRKKFKILFLLCFLYLIFRTRVKEFII